jgi:flagellar biogenesis protein FliO
MRRLSFIFVAALASTALADPATQPGTPIRTSVGHTVTSQTATALDLPRVLLSLAIVIAAILILRWAARRFLRLPTTLSGCGAVRVLSRTPVSPKQHVLALAVGKRVLIVADNGQQLSTLCELTDASDVRQFMEPIDDEKEEEKPIAPRAARDELRGLLSKVKVLSQQFR